jgi:large subunit ribosomal protein L25
MAMTEFKLDAEPRSDKGKGASRRLRRAKKVPAILYGGGQEPTALALSHDQLAKALEHEAFYSHVLNVQLDGHTETAVLRDVQRHPSKPVILHIDLQRVVESEALRVRVPLHFVGEDVAPGVKTGGGVVSHLLTEVDVACLPRDLPEFIEVDLSKLNIGDSIHLSDIPLPTGVELVELSLGAEHDLAVATIRPGRLAVEPEEEAAEGGEGGEGI